MTGHLSWETLNDLVDDVLPGDARQAAEAHAVDCERCARDLAGLRATLAAAAQLSSDSTPPEGLWLDVRSTIESRKVAHLPGGSRRPRGVWLSPGRAAAAAVLMVGLGAVTTGVVTAVREEGLPALPTAPATVAVSWQSSEREFLASVLDLREQLEALHGQLAPETLVKVERALATVDLAIAEAREALLRDPANAALSQILASNYRQKIELLRRVTQLASST